MKRKSYLILVLAIPFLIGCSTLKKNQPLLQNQEVRTNLIAVVSTTSSVPDALTVTNFVTKVSTNIVYTVNPVWTQAIETVKEVNAVANPTPIAPVVNVVLGLVVAGLGWFARFKTKQATEKGDLVKTLIQGVEAANNPEVKKAIADAARLAGVADKLHTEVRSQT